jgi:hypothetical protein
MYISTQSVKLVRWVARLLSGALLLFWGAFFLEHLSWFSQGAPAPSMFVWLMQGLHLILLVGYALSFKWEFAGSPLILLGAVLFFTLTGVPNALVFILLSSTPALLYLFCQFARGTGLSTPFAK